MKLHIYLLSGSSQDADHDEEDGQREEDNVDALTASRSHRLT
jgi:hypothetical protein